MKARALAASVLFAAILAGPARADEKADKVACVAASDEGQKLRDQGKLKSARDQFLVCARDLCPAAVRKDCAGWLASVEAGMPTIVLAAVDADQHDLIAVRVTMDGQPVVSTLDGKAIPVDPGPHKLRFEAEGLAPVEMPVLVREGEQRRVVSARFAPKSAPSVKDAPPPPPPPPPAPVSRPVPVAPIVLGVLGLGAFGSFAYLGITGKNDLAHLHETCGVTHTCAQADVDATHTKLLAADISLGAGVVLVGVATGLLIAHVVRAPKTAALRLDVLPVAKGGGAVVGGSF